VEPIPDIDTARALLAEPSTDPAILAQIAGLHPSLRQQVADHPSAYPDLIDWIATSGDAPVVVPETQASLAAILRSWFQQQWSAHRVRSLVAMGAVGVLVLGGGITAAALSAARSAPANEATAPEIHPTASAPSPTSSPTPVKPTGMRDYSIDESGGLIRNWDSYDFGPRSFILAKGDAVQKVASTRTFTTVAISDSAPIQETRATIVTDDPNYSISSIVYGTQQRADAPAGFVVGMKVTIPTSGLTPGSTALKVALYPAGAATASKTIDVPGTPVSSLTGVWLSGTTALLGVRTSTSNYTMVAIDTTSGSVLWTSPGMVTYRVTGDIVVGAQGRTYSSMTGGERGTLVGLRVATGETAWSIGKLDGNESFREFESYIGGDYARVGMGDRVWILDLNTGSAVLKFDSTEALAARDVTNGNIGMSSGTGSNTGLKFVSSSGSEIRFLQGADFAALGYPRLLAMLEGKAWISASNRTDLIDVATGAQDPRSPALVQNSGATTGFIPVATNGSVTLLSSGNAKRVVVHQNIPLTVQYVLDLD
jgi:hypothetical protein